MALFGKGDDPRLVIPGDVEYLRDLFRPWRDRHDVWDEMVYPDPTDDLITDRYPKLIPSDAGMARRLNSQYRTTFVGSGTKNLINRLGRALPHIEDQSSLTSTTDMVQQDKGSKTELFGYGVLNALDEDVHELAEGTGWLRRLYALIGHPGKAICRVQVQQGEGRQARVTADLMDPYLCYHEFTRHTKRFAYERAVALMDAKAIAEEVLDGDEADFEFRDPSYAAQWKAGDAVTLTDYWCEYPIGKERVVTLALLADGQVVAVKRMDFAHLPILVVCCNTMGRTYQRITGGAAQHDGHSMIRPRDYVSRHAEPWFAPIEQLVRIYNTVKTLEMDGIDLMIRPPLITRSEDGGFIIEDNRLFGGQQIALRADEFIEFLKYTNDAVVANSTIVASTERDMAYEFPDALRGVLAGDRESGHLFNLRTDAAEIAVQEYAQGAALMIEKVLAEVIHQFKQNPNLRISLSGMDYRGNEMGAYFHEDFQPSQFADSTVLRVRLAPMLPKDDLRAADIFGKLVLEEGLDKTTARSQILGVRNPLKVEERIQQDKVRAHPIWLEEQMLQAMWESYRLLQSRADAMDEGPQKTQFMLQATRAKKRAEAIEASLSAATGQPQQQQPQLGLPAPAQQPAQERVADNPQLMPTVGQKAPTDSQSGG